MFIFTKGSLTKKICKSKEVKIWRLLFEKQICIVSYVWDDRNVTTMDPSICAPSLTNLLQRVIPQMDWTRMFVKDSIITFFTSDKTHSEKENPWNVKELFLYFCSVYMWQFMKVREKLVAEQLQQLDFRATSLQFLLYHILHKENANNIFTESHVCLVLTLEDHQPCTMISHLFAKLPYSTLYMDSCIICHY